MLPPPAGGGGDRRCLAGQYDREYDERGRVRTETDPSFGTRIHQYLPTGEELRIGQNPSTADPDGVAGVEYTYGSMGRLVARRNVERQSGVASYPQGVTYSYDQGAYAAGKVTLGVELGRDRDGDDGGLQP